MKSINEMTLAECLGYLLSKNSLMDGRLVNMAARRISDLTRWIPIGERRPVIEDADAHGFVLVRQVENQSPKRVYTDMVRWCDILDPDYFYTVTHWRRIDI